MSYMRMKKVMPDGVVTSWLKEFRNAHGWGPFVWSALVGRYIPDVHHSAWSMDDDVSEALWALAGDERLAPYERVVLAMTFDRAWVQASDVPAVAQHLNTFDEVHHLPEHANHLPAIVDVLESNWDAKHGLAFYGNSVAGDQWVVAEECSLCGHAGEEMRPFNAKRDPGASLLMIDRLKSCVGAPFFDCATKKASR